MMFDRSREARYSGRLQCGVRNVLFAGFARCNRYVSAVRPLLCLRWPVFSSCASPSVWSQKNSGRSLKSGADESRSMVGEARSTAENYDSKIKGRSTCGQLTACLHTVQHGTAAWLRVPRICSSEAAASVPTCRSRPSAL